jgi:hypothetical protein
MAKLYLRKINNNEMTLEDVPQLWRAEVEALLAEQELS